MRYSRNYIDTGYSCRGLNSPRKRETQKKTFDIYEEFSKPRIMVFNFYPRKMDNNVLWVYQKSFIRYSAHQIRRLQHIMDLHLQLLAKKIKKSAIFATPEIKSKYLKALRQARYVLVKEKTSKSAKLLYPDTLHLGWGWIEFLDGIRAKVSLTLNNKNVWYHEKLLKHFAHELRHMTPYNYRIFNKNKTDHGLISEMTKMSQEERNKAYPWEQDASDFANKVLRDGKKVEVSEFDYSKYDDIH